MREIEASDWFENPNLVEIKASTIKSAVGGEVKLSNFTLRFRQSTKQRKKPAAVEGAQS